jgi:hypothetical protein
MYGMPRADRRTTNDDNALNNLRSQIVEPTPPSHMDAALQTVRSLLNDERTANREIKATLEKACAELTCLNQDLQISRADVDKWRETAEQNQRLYSEECELHQRVCYIADERELHLNRSLLQLEEKEHQIQKSSIQLAQSQKRIQSSQLEIYKWKEISIQKQDLYVIEKDKNQQTVCLYEDEKRRAVELIAKYEEADSQRRKYFLLYSETQTQLKHERKSKAGIRSWETRRKLENQRLKEEIAEMTVLLRESLLRKGEAVDNLYALADRMDQMQQLVDSVEDESEAVVHQTGLRQKLKRIWMSIQDILAE